MNYKNVFRFYLQICNHTLKMLPNMLLIKRLARLQMLGFICHHLPPSATACDIVFLWVADKLLVAILHWERGRLVPKIGLQPTSHLQPIKGDGKWWQMVADKIEHLQPR